MASAPKLSIDVDGIEVAVSNPDKVLFPEAGHTKLDLVKYFIAIAPGALQSSGGRPHQLVRFPNGIAQDHFYQKRAPEQRPPWVDTCVLHFPSGRTAEEVVPRNAATLAWMANLACLELHPHAVRAEDLDHPDELRIDLDPVPGVEWPQVTRVALVVQATLRDFGLVGWPKTSGSRGLHINVRIAARWSFTEVRRAALALAREVERRAPDDATSAWWKEERHGVFLDYNQNAKDRTTAGAYSVRPKPDARVSAPLEWDEVAQCDPAAFTLTTMPDRFAKVGHLHEGIEDAVGTLDALLELSRAQEEGGQGDAPWPPHYEKAEGEPTRVAPSRKKKSGTTKTAKRRAEHPMLEIAKAQHEADALAGLERWKARHPDVVPHLEPNDILVDKMRGRFRTWSRIRIDLQHVPEAIRPAQEPCDPDEAVGWEAELPPGFRRRGRDSEDA
ncbi:MAG TPA: non-homologous end-joining DNA ligase [Nannocystaceae bacterium]|nr:non-homologous end-joining DNA ligase [Nannocystaceae bacterium]